MAKRTKEERILLYNNFSRRDEVEKRLRNVARIANATVIPICNALGITVLKNYVLEWVYDEEAFMKAYVTKCKRDAGEGGSFMCRVITDAAESDFRTQLKFYPYPIDRGVTKLTEEEEKMMKLSGDHMTYDSDKLTEYTNVYLTEPKKIEAYHKCEELCRYLNEFYSGRMPKNDAFNSWASYVYPTHEGFKVNGRADFGKLTDGKSK